MKAKWKVTQRQRLNRTSNDLKYFIVHNIEKWRLKNFELRKEIIGKQQQW